MSKMVATLEELETLKIVENVSHTFKKQGIPNEAPMKLLILEDDESTREQEVSLGMSKRCRGVVGKYILTDFSFHTLSIL